MDRLNDRSAYYIQRAKDAEASGDKKRTTVSVGNGNVERWSLVELQHLHHAIKAAEEDYMTDGDCAVYVIGTFWATYTKIGMATSPVSRLASLQTGNPERLFLHRTFWFRDVQTAMRIERYAHLIASQRFTQLHGEWFKCGPTGAHTAIEDAANHYAVDYATITPMSVPQ